MRRSRGSAHRERGQVAVEAAIVMPLHVFLMLGLLQLFLVYQARLMTKYAAYKAVRAGALKSARVSEMERAALVALLPMIAEKHDGADIVAPTASATAATEKYLRVAIAGGRMPEAMTLRHAEVRICGPTRGEFSGLREVDFDDPQRASASVGGQNNPNWRQAQATKLRVQVTFNYRMPIPFANWVFYRIARGLELPAELRMGTPDGPALPPMDGRALAANAGVYVLPIISNYTMRMQSNIFVGQLPSQNDCKIPFAKR